MHRRRNFLFDLVPYVLLAIAGMTAARGVDFLRYVFTESRVAFVAVILWLGIATFAVWLARSFWRWARVGFPRLARAIAAVIFTYFMFAVAVGLSLQFVGQLLGITALQTGGGEPNALFTAIGLTVTALSMAVALVTVVAMLRVRRHGPGFKRPST